MKRFTKFVMLVMVLSMVLSACAPAAAPTQAPAQNQPAQNEPAASADPCDGAKGQTVEMWSPLTGPDGDEMTALATRFTKENKWGITAKHVAQPEYVQKLNAAAAAKKLPTMTVVRAINVAELAERHVLQPMSKDVLAILGSDVEKEFPANVFNAGLYKGERYSFPLDMHPLVMYYNKDMFKAAGIAEPTTTPWTKAEFESAVEKLNKDGVKGIAIGTAFQGATLFQSFIVQFGGSLATPDGAKANYNTEAAAKALQYIADMKGKYSPDISGAGDPEVNVFKQQKAAIVIHGPWHISDLVKLPWVGFAPLPTVGDKPAVWAGSHQLGLVNPDPKQQLAAACWINWLSNNSLEWAKAGQVPARTKIRLSEDLKQLAHPISMVAPSTENAIMLPQVPALEGALWDNFGPVVDAVLMGQEKDIKGKLEEANTKSQKVMDDNAAKYK